MNITTITITATSKMADQKPALKISPIASQLLKSIMAKRALKNKDNVFMMNMFKVTLCYPKMVPY